MNKKIASALVGILLIGIVTAGLVPYLSNMVTGTVTVEGPVFYATSDNRLLINEFEGSTVDYTIDDIKPEVFWTEELSEIMDFYKPKLTLYVNAILIEGIDPKDLRLKFEYVNKDGNVKDICFSDVSVHKEEYQVLSGGCEANSELIDVKKFIYTISGRGDTGTVYEIKIDGITRVKMDKA